MAPAAKYTAKPKGQQGRSARQPRQVQRSFWRGPWPVVIAVVAVVAVVASLLWLSAQHGPSTPGPTKAEASQVLAQVTDVSASVSSQIGSGGVANPLTRTNSGTLIKDSAGLPVVIYVGANYCPFCAAERWPLVLALSRFGTFDNLQLGTSSSTDAYPNTATFTFTGAGYHSSYIDFSFVETTSRTGQAIANPTALQQAEEAKYDSGGSIPFIEIAGRYYQVGSGYVPDVLQGLSWSGISGLLNHTDSQVAQDIVGNANWITAGICSVTGNQPASACSTPEVKALETKL